VRRTLLSILILLLAVFFIGDLVLKSMAETRMEKAMQSSLELGSRPEVTVDEWPFVFGLFQGEFSSVIVVADEIGSGEIDLRDLRLEFHDVRFSLGQLFSGDDRKVRVGRAEGTAVLPQSELNNALESQNIPVTVRFQEGRTVVRSSEFDAEAAAEVTIEDGRLVLTPEQGIDSIAVDLPEIAEGVSYGSVRIEEGKAVLTVRLVSTTVEF
jgi:hypothetical protein